MTKQEKVDFVIDTLKELYPQIPIPLDHKDPYTLLIAVLLSAQSTDVKVNQITPLLFELADNPYDMPRKECETLYSADREREKETEPFFLPIFSPWLTRTHSHETIS